MLRIAKHQFIDETGRVVHLRGVDTDDNSKLPVNGHGRDGISFVGRPFPLADADEHFGLRAWSTFLPPCW